MVFPPNNQRQCFLTFCCVHVLWWQKSVSVCKGSYISSSFMIKDFFYQNPQLKKVASSFMLQFQHNSRSVVYRHKVLPNLVWKVTNEVCLNWLYKSMHVLKAWKKLLTSSTFPEVLSFQQKWIRESSDCWMYTVPLRLSGVTTFPFRVILPARNSTRYLLELPLEPLTRLGKRAPDDILLFSHKMTWILERGMRLTRLHMYSHLLRLCFVQVNS